MKFNIDPSGFGQVTDASAQAAQQMREQFRSSLQDINKLTATTVREQTQQWNSVFSGMNRGFSQTIASMSNSSRTLQQNIARVLDQILADFLRMLERMVAQWVARHTFMQIFGIGSHKATTAANIGSSAAEGGAAAYASAAAIPVVGWSIAPAVAAEAYSNILGFEALNAFAAGGIVPDDSLALVHKNEMVLPASLSAGLSQMIASDESGGSSVHINFSVSATDSKSFESRLHEHADALVGLIKRAWRHGKF